MAVCSAFCEAVQNVVCRKYRRQIFSSTIGESRKFGGCCEIEFRKKGRENFCIRVSCVVHPRRRRQKMPGHAASRSPAHERKGESSNFQGTQRTYAEKTFMCSLNAGGCSGRRHFEGKQTAVAFSPNMLLVACGRTVCTAV